MGSEESAKPKEPTRTTNKKATPPTATKRATSDEKDFVDDKELMAAVQYGVLKTSDDVLLTINERNGQTDMKFDEEVISRVSAFVWDTVVDDWVNDLVALSNHAARQTVNLDDIAMLTRRNPQLFQTVREMTNLKSNKQSSVSRGSNNTTKGRKRKAIDINQPSTSKEEPNNMESSRSNSPILVITKTPKQAKISEVETPNPQKSSFLNTPVVQHMTSTPKVGSGSARAELFVTPIRQTTTDVDLTGIRKMDMTRIEEDEKENDDDSFDAVFGSPVASTSTKPNISSLIRMAEEDPLPGEKTLKEIEERDRVQAMMPAENEYDSFDDDIIFEEVVRPKQITNKNKSTNERSKSPDLFANSSGDSTLKNETKKLENQVEDKSNTVFSKKVTSFTFDDDGDSFDAPLKQDIPLKSKKPEDNSDPIVLSDEDSFDAPIKQSTAPKLDKTIERSNPIVACEEDSFETGPVKDNPTKTPKRSAPIPKWRATQEKWAISKPAKTPSPSSTTSDTKKKKVNLDYDSFDEFDFDV